MTICFEIKHDTLFAGHWYLREEGMIMPLFLFPLSFIEKINPSIKRTGEEAYIKNSEPVTRGKGRDE